MTPCARNGLPRDQLAPSSWPDWLYWEQCLTDISGTQEKESRGFAELLGRMIGVPIIPPAL
jgi:hypothetical protein